MMRKLVLMTLFVVGSATAHVILGVAVAAFVASDVAGSNPEADLRVSALRIRSMTEPEKTAKLEPIVEQVRQPPAGALAAPESDPSNLADNTISTDPSLRARYYESHEVDIPAAPLPDWEVDADQLVTSGVRRLSFAVWVDERGVARKCKVLIMDPVGALKPEAIAARLCTTNLMPAVRRGVKVASVRHIELVLAQ
ncbi:MAG: hypothetical protein JF606_01055 [Burkholderiales bacterium]|jgi:hypothetical protein|nr:hypothetical protein [Burkholderiales bacterium]